MRVPPASLAMRARACGYTRVTARPTAAARRPAARRAQLLNMSLTLFGRLHARHDAVVLLLMGALAFLVSSASAEIDDDFGFLLCYLVARRARAAPASRPLASDETLEPSLRERRRVALSLTPPGALPAPAGGSSSAPSASSSGASGASASPTALRSSSLAPSCTARC